MQSYPGKDKCLNWFAGLLLVLLVINIRVAAGIGSTFERAVDGLVGLGILLAAVFVALDFFEVIKGRKRKP